MKQLTILFVTLSLSSCMLNPFSSDGISVDAQVGKTNEKVTGVKAEEFSLVKKETTAEFVVEDAKFGNITSKGNITIDEQVPVWIWLLALLGWMLPAPSQIWLGLGMTMLNIKRYIKE